MPSPCSEVNGKKREKCPISSFSDLFITADFQQSSNALIGDYLGLSTSALQKSMFPKTAGNPTYNTWKKTVPTIIQKQKCKPVL